LDFIDLQGFFISCGSFFTAFVRFLPAIPANKREHFFPRLILNN